MLNAGKIIAELREEVAVYKTKAHVLAATEKELTLKADVLSKQISTLKSEITELEEERALNRKSIIELEDRLYSKLHHQSPFSDVELHYIKDLCGMAYELAGRIHDGVELASCGAKDLSDVFYVLSEMRYMYKSLEWIEPITSDEEI